MIGDSKKKFNSSNSCIQQNENLCWTFDTPESTMSFGITLTKKFADLSILLLDGPLGAGKTTLVKGFAQGLGILEPITSPTFPLSQHYPSGSPPLIHLDLYRIEDSNAANEFFLQEEEQSKLLGAIMIVEWPQRLTLPLEDAWRGQLKYSSRNEARLFQLIPPLYKDNMLSTSTK